jgi:NADH:ubiquinone oxidoreductase subunit 5 (subunit L)/multisubunit Na+/H+ antiporter MnhA subunit
MPVRELLFALIFNVATQPRIYGTFTIHRIIRRQRLSADFEEAQSPSDSQVSPFFNRAFHDYQAGMVLRLPEAAAHEAGHSTELIITCLSIAIALAGIWFAHRVYVARPGTADRIVSRIKGLYALIYNKYWVDEAYERFLGGPLVWLSDRVFLRLGDRVLLDGSLNGMARIAQRVAGGLARVQTGGLHRYVFYVLLGSLPAWPHGTPSRST